MAKVRESLNDLYRNSVFVNPNGEISIESWETGKTICQQCEVVEKALDKYEKFVDICRTKSVYIHLLQQCGDVESYNEYFINRYGLDEHTQRLLLTPEEFDLLKEMLK